MKTTTEVNHTPTPWRLSDGAIMSGINDRVIRSSGFDCGTRKDNAAFIVRAVNSHEALVSAAQEALDFIQRNSEGIALDVKDSLRLALKQAIAQAEGK